MHLKLTDRHVRSAKAPKTGRLVITDTEVSGLSLRVTDKGRKSWQIRYRPKGQNQRYEVPGPYPAITLADARQRAREILTAAKRGVDLPEQELRDKEERQKAVTLPGTVGDLCDRYVEQHLEKNVRRWEAAKGEIENHIKPHLGALMLEEIERGHVREMLNAIKPEYPVAANRALQRLRAVFNWGAENDLARIIHGAA